jgi:hypothetical protein
MHPDLIKNSYVIITNFIDSDRAKSLSEQFHRDHEKNQYGSDDQAPNSACVYNYEPSLKLLHEKVGDLSEFLQNPVLPTYSYSRIYAKGEVLKKHTDRLSCEISVSVNLDSDKEWPLYIYDSDNVPHEINLGPGDAVAFLGCFQTHWRLEYTGNYCSQVFLHYVRENGSAVEYVNDGGDKLKEQENRIKVINEYIGMGWIAPHHIKVELGKEVKKSATYLTNVADAIVYYKNAIDPDVCDRIIEYCKDKGEWKPALTEGDTAQGLKQSKLRKCDTYMISGSTDPVGKEMDGIMFKAYNTCLNDYSRKFRFASVDGDDGYTILRYGPGGEYIEHIDQGPKNNRSFTGIMALNDDYEGGGLEFSGGSVTYQLAKGSVILFPSSFMYPHRVVPVISGTRYTVVTWFL